MPYYAYMLYSENHGRYYKGSSSDVLQRLKRHNAGDTISTKPFMPCRLVYVEVFDDKLSALRREKNLNHQVSE